MFTYTPPQSFEANKVRITWDAELKYKYSNQRYSLYRRDLRIVDDSESVSSTTNSAARKSQGTNDVGKLILDGMKIGGYIANGVGYGMTRANLLQLRQEIDNYFSLCGDKCLKIC